MAAIGGFPGERRTDPNWKGDKKEMDPNETLNELRYLFKNSPGDTDLDNFASAHERFEALDEWLTKGGFSPWPANSEPNRFADQRARMSDAQRNRLWQMCADYNVPFREDDYQLNFNNMQSGWVEGWIGGEPGTIYTGVSPKGDSHT